MYLQEEIKNQHCDCFVFWKQLLHCSEFGVPNKGKMTSTSDKMMYSNTKTCPQGSVYTLWIFYIPLSSTASREENALIPRQRWKGINGTTEHIQYISRGRPCAQWLPLRCLWEVHVRMILDPSMCARKSKISPQLEWITVPRPVSLVKQVSEKIFLFIITKKYTHINSVSISLDFTGI